MTRRIFVGDIQGCREELERLLEALRFDPAADELHPVGDFVNRGPDSLGTLALLHSLDAGGVLGNHDLHLLGCANGSRKRRAKDTFHDVLESDRREELLTWLAARPLGRAWDDLLLVHAAISPAWRDPAEILARLDPRHLDRDCAFATMTRYCDAEGNRPPSNWPPPPLPYRPWFEFWPERSGETRTVVFGHWARMGLVQRETIRGLDTGCVWGGSLTAWIAEENRLVQVPAIRAHAPYASEG